MNRCTERRLWNQDEEEKQYGKTFWLEEEVVVSCVEWGVGYISLCLDLSATTVIMSDYAITVLVGRLATAQERPQPIIIHDPVEFMGHQGGRKGRDMKNCLKEAGWDGKEANSWKKKKKKKWLSLMATEVW